MLKGKINIAIDPRYKFLVLILFLLLYQSQLYAQYKYTIPQFVNETFDFVKQPLKWEGEDYLKLGLITLGAGLTMFADEPIRAAVDRDQRFNKSAPIEFGRIYGELYSPVAFFSGFAVYSLVFKDMKARKIAYEIGQASLYAGAINFILKVSIGRARPNLGSNTEGAFNYKPFYTIIDGDYHSMPGGHSTVAFTISTILSRNVKPLWLKVLIYVPAVMTSVSRVYQGWHWTSDNIVGAAFGYYIATWVVDKHEKVIKPGTKNTKTGLMDRIQYMPIFMGGYYGLNLSVSMF